MASKLTDKERELKIREVINYALTTGDSYKKIAEKCGISVATVADYLNNRVYDSKQEEQIRAIYKKKDPQYQKNNLETLQRVYKSYNLLMSGLTIASIADELNSTVMIIERDLKNRLGRYSDEKAKLASKVLKFNSIINVQNTSNKDLKKECKLFILNDVEERLMVYGSSYLDNGIDDIKDKYTINENDLLIAFDEILPLIDLELGTKVKQKMEFENNYKKRK